MKHTRQNKQAFTLIELLVVISIIALLVGILLPALGAARKTAQRAVCLSNQRQIGVGLMGYTTNNDGFLPYKLYQEGGFEVYWWHRMILDGAAAGSAEEGANSNLVCPSDISPYLPSPATTPPDPAYENVRSSYGINQYVSHADGVTNNGGHELPNGEDANIAALAWHRIGAMLSPSELMLTGEIYRGHMVRPDLGATYDLSATMEASLHTDAEHAATWHTPDWGRHSGTLDDPSGSINLLYTDGHAASITRAEFIVPAVASMAELDAAKRLFWPKHANPVAGN